MKNLIFIVLLFLICACSATSPYKPEGYGGGYTDMPLGGGKYNITARGNGFTGLKRVQDIAMVRAAVITKTEGDGFFIILDSNQDAKILTTGSGNTNTSGNHNQQTQSYKNNYHTITIKLIPSSEAIGSEAISSEVIINRLGREVGYQ